MERRMSNSAEGSPRPGAVYVRRPTSARKGRKEKQERSGRRKKKEKKGGRGKRRKGKKEKGKKDGTLSFEGTPPPQVVEDRRSDESPLDIRSEGTFRTRRRRAKPIAMDSDEHVMVEQRVTSSSYTWSSDDEHKTMEKTKRSASVPEFYSKSKINLSMSSPIISDGDIEVLGTLKQTLSPRSYNKAVSQFVVKKYESSVALRDWYKSYEEAWIPVMIVLSPRGQTYNRGHLVVFEPHGCTFNGEWCLLIRAEKCVINGSKHFLSDCANNVVASTETMVQGGSGNVRAE